MVSFYNYVAPDQQTYAVYHNACRWAGSNRCIPGPEARYTFIHRHASRLVTDATTHTTANWDRGSCTVRNCAGAATRMYAINISPFVGQMISELLGWYSGTMTTDSAVFTTSRWRFLARSPISGHESFSYRSPSFRFYTWYIPHQCPITV
jgi:hypothetical protein